MIAFLKKTKLLFLAGIFIFTACNEDDNVVDPSFDEDDEIANLIVPDFYTFERGGQSTVRIPGQVERIAMLEEIDRAFTDFDGEEYGSTDAASFEAVLNSLFINNPDDNIVWTNDFLNNTVLEGSDLNESGRQIRNTMADSEDYFLLPGNTAEAAKLRAQLDGFIVAQATNVFPNVNVEAAPGVAGFSVDSNNGTSNPTNRFINANGWEINEVFEKSLIGSLQLDQIVNNYLSVNLLDEGSNREDNDNEVPRNDSGTDTQMEHFWDEGFGYVYGLSCDIENVTRDLGENDGNYNNYLDLVNDDLDFRGIADEIFLAFRTGRAAIIASEYDIRDEQAAILRELLSEVMAVRTVFYLQQGRMKLEGARADNGQGEFGDGFHDVSEGLGFLLGLRFTQDPNTNQPYYTPEQVQAWFTEITSSTPNGLWDIDLNRLDEISDAIAAPFGFTRQMAAFIDDSLPNSPGCE